MDAIQHNSIQSGAEGNATQSEGTSDYSKIMSGIASDTPDANVSAGTEGQSNAVNEGTQLPAWTSQLPKEMAENGDMMKQLSKFTKIGDLAKSYAELEAKLGRSTSIPSNESTDEEKQAFYEKLGKPSTAEAYGLPENAVNFSEIAYKNNLTVEQAKAVYEALELTGKQTIEANQAAQAQMIAETDRGLRAEYGDKYDEKMQLMDRGIKGSIGAEVGKVLLDAGVLYHPSIARLFVKIGEMTAESGNFSKGNTGGSSGYKSTADGGSFTFKGL